MKLMLKETGIKTLTEKKQLDFQYSVHKLKLEVTHTL